MKKREDQSMLVALAAFGIAFLGMIMTSCACGYMSIISLPCNLLGAGGTWFAFLMGKDRLLTGRIVIDLTLVVATLMLLRNIGDILWWGHSPLFE